MIETISNDRSRLWEATSAAAAMNYRPPVRRTHEIEPVQPDSDLVRSLGHSTDADAFGGSSPDLQALLDALLHNYGSEDLDDAQATNLDVQSEVRDNREGTRESIRSLNDTAQSGEMTVALHAKLNESTDEVDRKSLSGELENQERLADLELDRAENLSFRAQDSRTRVDNGVQKSPRDRDIQFRSAEVFDQKSAAAESSTRLHRVMVQRTLRPSQEGAANSGVVDANREFFQKLQNMHAQLRFN